MTILQAVVYGIVEGVTEFLPISSTAHLIITPKVFGWEDPSTAFTAIIQLGAIFSVLLYFWSDLSKAFMAWVKSFTGGPKDTPEVKTGWAVFVATIIISVIGLALHKYIEGPFRSLYVVAGSMFVMGVLMLIAEKLAKQTRSLSDINMSDGVKIGLWQCIALIPGMSRSGSSISGALFGGFDRASAARLSFLMSVPAITLAGLYEGAKEFKHLKSENVMMPTVVATIVSFIVGYACIKWLLGFIQRRGIAPFVWYRFALGALLIFMCASGKWNPNPTVEGQSPKSENVTNVP